ncbi:hypothetical protein BHE74_00049044 [Ensete ventricosum]|nr:hypothetical protein BHE74_00049044 [Ensete ventricosum]
MLHKLPLDGSTTRGRTSSTEASPKKKTAWSVVGSRTDNDVKNYWNTDLKKKKKKKKKQKKKKQANSIHCP